MIDRFIKLLVLCLGGLLIVLVGHLLINEGGDASRPASSQASRAEPEAGKSDLDATDLATKRVKTVPVRPQDLSTAPQ